MRDRLSWRADSSHSHALAACREGEVIHMCYRYLAGASTPGIHGSVWITDQHLPSDTTSSAKPPSTGGVWTAGHGSPRQTPPLVEGQSCLIT